MTRWRGCGTSRCRAPDPRSEVALFRPIDPKQDLVELEHEILDMWRERRTFARLRAQLAGKDRWSFQLNVYNLTDEVYARAAVSNLFVVPGPQRTFRFTTAYSF